MLTYYPKLFEGVLANVFKTMFVLIHSPPSHMDLTHILVIRVCTLRKPQAMPSPGCRAPMGLSVRFVVGPGPNGPGMRDLGVPGASTAPLTRWGEMGSAPFIAAISERTKAIITLLDSPEGTETQGTRGHTETAASNCQRTLPLPALLSTSLWYPPGLGCPSGVSEAGGPEGWGPGEP